MGRYPQLRSRDIKSEGEFVSKSLRSVARTRSCPVQRHLYLILRPPREDDDGNYHARAETTIHSGGHAEILAEFGSTCFLISVSLVPLLPTAGTGTEGKIVDNLMIKVRLPNDQIVTGWLDNHDAYLIMPSSRFGTWVVFMLHISITTCSLSLAGEW